MKKVLCTLAAALAMAACSNNGNGDGGGTSTSAGSNAGASSGGRGSTSGTSAGNASGGSTSNGGTSSGRGTTGAAAGTTGAGTSGGGSNAGSTGGSNGSLLLVDNDGYTLPNGGGDPPLTLFENWVTGATIYQEPSDGSDTTDVDASNPTLTGINDIVFFTADNLSPLRAAQQGSLQNWLNQGGHTLALFSSALIYGIGINDWTSNEPNAFLTQILGAQADVDNPNVWSSPSADTVIDSTTSNVVTGSSTVPAFSGKQWTATTGASSVSYYFSIIAPIAGVDVLATVLADPTSSGTANTPEPVALGRKHVGTAGTSTVVWVGFTVENIQANLTGFNNLADFFTAVQTYASLP